MLFSPETKTLKPLFRRTELASKEMKALVLFLLPLAALWLVMKTRSSCLTNFSAVDSLKK